MKNQMAKRIASVLLAGVMLVSLAACGENKKTETEDKTQQHNGETPIEDMGLGGRGEAFGHLQVCLTGGHGHRCQHAQNGKEDFFHN